MKKPGYIVLPTVILILGLINTIQYFIIRNEVPPITNLDDRLLFLVFIQRITWGVACLVLLLLSVSGMFLSRRKGKTFWYGFFRSMLIFTIIYGLIAAFIFLKKGI